MRVVSSQLAPKSKLTSAQSLGLTNVMRAIMLGMSAWNYVGYGVFGRKRIGVYPIGERSHNDEVPF